MRKDEIRRRIRSLRGSWMLRIFENWAEYPLGCSLKLEKKIS
jgi:hypothetical protein